MNTDSSPAVSQGVAARSVPPPEVVEVAPVVVCLACRHDFAAFEAGAEAAFFAGVHNGLHHGGRPEAFLTVVDEPTHPAPGPAVEHGAGEDPAVAGWRAGRVVAGLEDTQEFDPIADPIAGPVTGPVDGPVALTGEQTPGGSR